MKIVEIEQIRLNTTANILRVNQTKNSFIASFGLGFFDKVIKEFKSEISQNALRLLYQFNSYINELLITSGFEQYLEYFQNFGVNLQSFTNLIEYVQILGNEYILDTIYYVFSAIYAHIYKIPLFYSHPTDLNTFKVYIEYFCTQLGVSLIIYNNHESFTSIGSGLSIDLYYENSDYSLILSFGSTVGSSQYLIEEIFTQISIPKSLKQFDSIIEIIKSFQQQYGKLTQSMDNILNIRKMWTCSHDLKAMKFSCGQKHCLYCIFENIKFCAPEEAQCRCGYLLTPDEYEKVFRSVQPLFPRHFRCYYCKKNFNVSASITCEGHKLCIDCRSVNKKNCVICSRPYSDLELQKFKFLDEQEMKFEDNEVNPKLVAEKIIDSELKKEKIDVQCQVCGGELEQGVRYCNNSCEICRICWRNLRNCYKCGENTNNIIKVVCSYCKKDRRKTKKLIQLNCKHVYHKDCSKFDNC